MFTTYQLVKIGFRNHPPTICPSFSSQELGIRLPILSLLVAFARASVQNPEAIHSALKEVPGYQGLEDLGAWGSSYLVMSKELLKMGISWKSHAVLGSLMG